MTTVLVYTGYVSFHQKPDRNSIFRRTYQMQFLEISCTIL